MSIKKLLERKKCALVMGIINTTPDSFFKQSRKESLHSALETAQKMARDSVDIIDIGGESTRPGAQFIDIQTELDRVIPVVSAIAREIGKEIAISVDTRKALVAQKAIEAGASIINDISSMQDDADMLNIVKKSKCDIIIMHKRGAPLDMQTAVFYNNAVDEIFSEIENLVQNAVLNGVEKERIIIDPGIGFGKRTCDNIDIIKNIDFFKKTGFPILIGHSRKSFLGEITGRNAGDQLAASLAAGILALINGADILRVHDVKETVDTLKILQAFQRKVQ